MTENKIKSEKASKYINYHCIDIDTIYPLTNDQVEEVIIIAETELTEAHAKELQELKDKAVESFMKICPIGHPERPKNVGLKGGGLCPHVDIIGFPCCNDRCPFILSFLTHLNK